MSSAQAAAARELASLAEMQKRSCEEKASLTDAILAVPWHGSDLAELLHAVLAAAPKTETSETASKGSAREGERRKAAEIFPQHLVSLHPR